MNFFKGTKHFAKSKKNRLKDLRLTSVDFCRQGANPEADIKLRKNLFPDGGGQAFRDEQWRQALNERLWRLQDALINSFRSIIEETPDSSAQRESLLLGSLGEFQEETARLITELCRDSPEPDQETERPPEGAQKSNQGACCTMKIKDLNIDVSALSAEEQAQLGALVEKAVPAPQQEPPTAEPSTPGTPPAQDPALAKAVETYTSMAKKLEAQVERLEAQELDQVAKKYEVLGDDNLRETLGVMKAAGETAYTGYLAALDRQLELLEKSDSVLLGEVGRSSHGESGGTAVEKAHAAAAAIRKADPSLSQQEAMVRAFEMDPDLAAEYEKEYAERRQPS